MKYSGYLLALSIVLFLFIDSQMSYAQANYWDVVYLKNGSIIRGVIIEQIPSQSIKIQTRDENVFFYRLEEIEKLTKEEPKGGSETRTAAGIAKGTVIVSANSNAYFSSYFPDNGTSTSSYNVALGVGYFFVKNLNFGASIRYYQVGSASSTGVGAFGRYYIEGKVFTELGIVSYSGSGTSGSTTKYVQLGYAAFLTKNIAIEPMLEYSRGDTFGSLSVYLGFTLFLNRMEKPVKLTRVIRHKLTTFSGPN